MSDPLSELRALHAAVDAEVAELSALHQGRLQCARGCAGCCLDDLSVFALEAERIRAEAGELLREGSPHPPGACAFLDGEGACRVYAARPYVCRSQGLPLRWLEEREGQVVELRDICPLNEPEDQPPLEELAPESCWPIGPVEARLRELQAAHEPETPLRRVPLRDLFLASESGDAQ
ncbi:MAG TPA: hypothetical protein DEA08_18130 [Planctomycetes bacterium]|nr:hypothetical protein [Planctomycetota bacterium]